MSFSGSDLSGPVFDVDTLAEAEARGGSKRSALNGVFSQLKRGFIFTSNSPLIQLSPFDSGVRSTMVE